MIRIGIWNDKRKTLASIEGNSRNPKNRDLEEEQAAPATTSIRQPIFYDSIAYALTPKRLHSVIETLKTGDAREFLTLAEEFEESDLHYRSVIAQRKSQVTGLPCFMQAADDSPKANEIAESVTRDILKATWFKNMQKDLLDALAKGYSVCEIIWKSHEGRWIPEDVKWRDPRYFRYDRETMSRLVLDEAGSEVELLNDKFIIHQPHLKSGHPLRSGLALPAAYYYLIKYSDVAGWAALAQVYGYPLRIGRYGRNASKQDKEVLRRALANLGRDVGAIIPDAMKVEIINGITSTGNITLYKDLAEWVDKEISKLVLGQTMSTDAEGGQYKGDLHNEVRLEIRDSDADQLAATIQRDLIAPYVKFNFGLQKENPKFVYQIEETEDIEVLCSAIEKLVPLGLKIRTDDMYSKLGLTKPSDDDEILEPQAGGMPPMLEVNRSSIGGKVELNDQLEEVSVDRLIEDEAGDWIEVSKPLKDMVEEFASDCSSYDEFLERFHELERKLELDHSLARRIALATFKARALADSKPID